MLVTVAFQGVTERYIEGLLLAIDSRSEDAVATYAALDDETSGRNRHCVIRRLRSIRDDDRVYAALRAERIAGKIASQVRKVRRILVSGRVTRAISLLGVRDRLHVRPAHCDVRSGYRIQIER